MKRLVHLDFKGAPPKLSYIKRILKSIKCMGAVGIILEWEDTFPYSGRLADVGSATNSGGDDMYNTEEVLEIFRFCKEYELEVIQSVPTIYHLEFVLKQPSFKRLREYTDSPSELSLSNQDSLAVVCAMLEQLLDIQQDAKYFLIGPVATCPDCTQHLDRSDQRTAKCLEHIRNLALFLKQKQPELTVIVNDEFLKSASPETLKAYQLGELIQPLICHSEHFQTDQQMWDKYRMFDSVWAGSVFRGVQGPGMRSDFSYETNYQSWKREIEKYSPIVSFAGVILFGWSRYDHYGALRELLPTSLPNIALGLKILDPGGDCRPQYDCLHDVFRSHEAYFIHAKEFINSDMVKTWLNPWQIRKKYTSPAQIQSIVMQLRSLLQNIRYHERLVLVHLNEITGRRSVEEWMKTYVTPIVNKLTQLLEVAEVQIVSDASVRPV